ncbi:hypothetical protein K5E_21310 [Enterococcus thailandicus]|uniref:glycosyltransferase family 2 protein n=1 Tax=Enterococcus thailandicus TaxID=417368 RepID=UPI00244D8A5D|nr:glycosyltransferase family 2 protein [Enterococcus thailandicus]GMC02828.1 hypothetical protein K4E_03410 [Enterococcus thailandicus]GMC09992.1 hypothetical protein K5E_21310 [Enterococcus thailandicus]
MFNLPINIFHFIEIFITATSLIVFFHLAFYTLLALFGLKRPKKNYAIAADEKRFLFIIPAHNEEKVIANCLNSLEKMEYQNELYDTVVLADHCQDDTAQIVKNYPQVFLFENQYEDGESRGKPHVIGKYLKQFKEVWKNYDYIIFLDADNLVSINFLKEMNSQFIAFPEYTIIQGYLDTKNVSESIMSRGYAAAYFITNRAIQFAKHRVGWNTSVGGTGFALSTEYLKENGWTPRSYTEDFEIQVELSIQGKKSTWNHFAKVYDEKPNEFKASHVQRTRWSQGHWLIAFTKLSQQVAGLFKSKDVTSLLSRIETIVYSFSMLRAVWLFFLVVLILIDSRFIKDFPYFFSTMWFWLFFEICNYIIIPIVYILQEGRCYFNSYKGLNFIKEFALLWIGYFYSTTMYYFAQIQGFFTWFFPQNVWKKTEHSSRVTSDSID